MKEAIQKAFAFIALLVAVKGLIVFFFFIQNPTQDSLVTLIETVAVPYWVGLPTTLIAVLVILAALVDAEDTLA